MRHRTLATLGAVALLMVVESWAPVLAAAQTPSGTATFKLAPFNHDSESEILQTPEYVVMLMQANNDARIISLDGRPHLPQNVRQWLGDSRGH